MRKFVFLFLMIVCTGCSSVQKKYDVCVYGGTSSAVIASYTAAQMGKNVILISPDQRLGGMTSGGLGYTDIGNKQAVMGLAKQFYRKVGEHYGKLEQWIFEPSVAETIMEEYATHPNIRVMKGYMLQQVHKEGPAISDITVFSQKGENQVISADCFIDATYEGDLMAEAGVTYHIGREDNMEYDETWNGSQLLTGHQFPDGVDPYVIPGEPESGLLWGVSDQNLNPDGTGDTLVQAYNYRICLTDSLENMIPITMPENYDPSHYELLLRLIDAQPSKRELNHYFIWSKMPGHKTDINNRGGFSTDMIGMNYGYPEADYNQRKEIIKAHEEYTKGLLYFIGHDSRVPEELRSEMLRWGYPKDEYVENGNWTPQLYVRESRRMVGRYIVTQKDCEGKARVDDGIAYAAYNMDSHNCQRVVIEKNGKKMVKNEGNVEIPGGYPYPVSYKAITPLENQCTNLLVPVCLSASHIAYGSVRMEPVFMALGQAAGIAASLMENSVQDVDASAIQMIMKENPFMDGSAPDILIDDNTRFLFYSSKWIQKRGTRGFGPTYLELVDGDMNDVVKYELPSDLMGEYTLYSYQQLSHGLNPTTYFDVNIGDKSYHNTFYVNDMVLSGQTSGDWYRVGTYDFSKGSDNYVQVYSKNEKRPLRTDALLLIKKDK